MTICYFGIYNNQYSRNKNIIKGLRENGVNIIEVTDITPGIKKFWKLFKKYWKIRKKFDIMIVGFPGQIIVPFAKLLTRKPVVYDLHVSYYDSIAIERKQCKPYSLKGAWYYFLDWTSCHLADKVLLDTKEHVRYISKLLHLKADKFIVIYTGIDDGLFKPIPPKEDKSKKFIISFHGYIQLLNGMDLVIKAMDSFKDSDIELWVIGGGSEYGNIKKLAEELKLDKVIFFPPMKPEDLINKVSQADLGLGFFGGNSKKIDRVIANKVYELMALKVPVLTGESIATKEHFKHKEHIYYCRKGEVESIANAIKELKNNESLRVKIRENAYHYTKEKLNTKVLGEIFLPKLEKLLNY
ncbi:MAG: glycosyltransferase family 4 protein [Patescibacteria group bacterium]